MEIEEEKEEVKKSEQCETCPMRRKNFHLEQRERKKIKNHKRKVAASKARIERQQQQQQQQTLNQIPGILSEKEFWEQVGPIIVEKDNGDGTVQFKSEEKMREAFMRASGGIPPEAYNNKIGGFFKNKKENK